MYLLISLLFYFLNPDFLFSLAELLRGTFNVEWHGGWFWFIGLMLIGANYN